MKIDWKKLLNFASSFLPVAIIVLVFNQWFFHFGILTGHDYTFFSSAFTSEWTKTLSYIWASAIGLGTNISYVVPYFPYEFIIGLTAMLGGDYGIGTRIVFLYPVLVLIILFSAFFLKGRKLEQIIAASIGFCVFVFNTFTLTIATWPNMFTAYFLMPVIFYIFYLYMKKRDLLCLTLCGILFFVSAVYEVRIAFITLLTILFFYLYNWIVIEKNSKWIFADIKRFVLLFIVEILLLAYVIVPLVFGKTYSSVLSITSQSLFGDEFFNVSHSMSLSHPYWTGETLKVFSLQKVQLLFWIFPALAFSSLFFYKKNKYIPFFGLLALIGIFLGSGSNQPLGLVYTWMYYNLPIFDFFREPIEWWAFIGFSYAVLTSLFYIHLWNFLEKAFKNSKKKEIFSKLLTVLPILILMYLIIPPIMTAKVGTYFKSLNSPQDVGQTNKLLSKDKTFSRNLFFPDRSRFSFFDNTHPALTFFSTPKELQSLNPKILSLLSVKYIVIPSDPTNDLYYQYSPKSNFEKFLTENLGQPQAKIGDTKIWKTIIPPYPHISTLPDLIYVSGSSDIKSFIDFDSSNKVGYYIQNDIPIGATQTTAKKIQQQNRLFSQIATKRYVIASCVRCDNTKKAEDFITIPFASILPNSPLYFLVQFKEKRSLSKFQSPDYLATQEIFLAEKRLIEIQNMRSKSIDSKYTKETIIRISQLLNDVYNKVYFSNLTNDSLITINDYLVTEKATILDQFGFVRTLDSRNLLKKLVLLIDKIQSNISSKDWISEDQKKRFFVTLPNSEIYRIYLKTDSEASLSHKLIFNDRELVSSTLQNGYESFGMQSVEKGTYHLEIDNNPVNLIKIPTQDIILNSDQNKVNIPINGFNDPQSSYEVSFDYLVSSVEFTRVYVNQSSLSPDNPLNNMALDTSLNTTTKENKNWQTFKMTISPVYGLKNPYLHFEILSGDRQSQMIIKNISITKIWNPTVIFVNDTGKKLVAPRVTSQEKNPADYAIHVTNASSPFLLYFSEGFDSGWNLYKNNTFSPTDNLTLKSNEIVSNSTADIATILASGLKPPLFSNNHVAINMVNNGWIINKSGTFSLDLIYDPQRDFLFGSGISLATFILAIAYLIHLLRKGKKHEMDK